MTISYPLTIPASPHPDSISYKLLSVVGATISPFTLQEKVYDWNASKVLATVQMPVMTQAQARAWLAFLFSLDGVSGTFYLPNYDYPTPVGTPLGSPKITSISADGKTITLGGWTPTKTGLLLPGDWIQLSTGQMVMSVESISSNGAGASVSAFRPGVRDITITTEIITTATKGIFRLSENVIGWTVDNLLHHGITINCEEAIS